MDTRNPHDLTVEEFDNLYESAIDIFERRSEVFGELDNGTLNSLGHISQICSRAGLIEQAVGERTVIERLEAETHGEVAIPTLRATARRLHLALRLGDRRAQDMLAVVASTVSRIAGPDHPLVAYCNDSDA